MGASRALHLTIIALATLMGGAAFASNPALVVEVDTGRVLHAERATDPWFPASITKLMTTYVALDMVRQGRASMDQLLSVSENAAKLPPSKMAFKPGTQIRLDNALKIIMVKSANDVAATIAENLGGSVEAFASMMNDAARRLGMRESHFVNPHGLPDDRQQTSARDMAILARALLREFPNHDDLFHIGAIQFGRRIMKNHNGLIGRYPGADGMKTGFICSAGFNVVASAERNGRRLITVVLGSSSANERTVKAAELFDRGFDSHAGFFSPKLEALATSSLQEPPNMRSLVCDRRGPMLGEDDGSASAGAEAETGNGPNLLSPNVLAFTGDGVNSAQRTVLGPRAPVKPIPVWIGMNPPTAAELAAQDAEEAQLAAQLAKKKGKKAIAAKSKKATEVSAPAEKGKTGRANAALKPGGKTDKVKEKPGVGRAVIPAKATAAKPASKVN